MKTPDLEAQAPTRLSLPEKGDLSQLSQWNTVGADGASKTRNTYCWRWARRRGNARGAAMKTFKSHEILITLLEPHFRTPLIARSSSPSLKSSFVYEKKGHHDERIRCVRTSSELSSQQTNSCTLNACVCSRIGPNNLINYIISISGLILTKALILA